MQGQGHVCVLTIKGLLFAERLLDSPPPPVLLGPAPPPPPPLEAASAWRCCCRCCLLRRSCRRCCKSLWCFSSHTAQRPTPWSTTYTPGSVVPQSVQGACTVRVRGGEVWVGGWQRWARGGVWEVTALELQDQHPVAHESCRTSAAPPPPLVAHHLVLPVLGGGAAAARALARLPRRGFLGGHWAE